MRIVPSTIEYSLCRRRWTKDGAVMKKLRRSAAVTILLRSCVQHPHRGAFRHSPVNRAALRQCSPVACLRDRRSPLRSPAGATPAPSAPPTPAPATPAPYVEPPPPPVNLQGFPPSYRLGFGDGCATGRGTEKKDPVRYRQRRQLSRRLAGRPRAVQDEMSVRRVQRNEAIAVAARDRSRPRLPRAHMGRSARAQALPAARLDGRLGVVPVPGRRAGRRLARARAGLARLRLVRNAAGRLLVRRLRRRSRCAGAHAGAGRADRRRRS